MLEDKQRKIYRIYFVLKPEHPVGLDPRLDACCKDQWIDYKGLSEDDASQSLLKELELIGFRKDIVLAYYNLYVVQCSQQLPDFWFKGMRAGKSIES